MRAFDPSLAYRLALAGVLSALLAFPALADDAAAPPRTVSVSGEGVVTGTPDVARIVVGVETEAPEADAALSENSARMARLIEALDAFGVAARDRQTAQISLQPQYDYQERQRPVLRGYTATNTLNLRLRDIASMGAALDALVEAGGNRIQGISFEISDADERLDAARAEAVADARRKAEIYAEAAGATLGAVMTISEGGAPSPVQPMMVRSEALAARVDVPVEAGEQTLSVRVSTQWRLED